MDQENATQATVVDQVLVESKTGDPIIQIENFQRGKETLQRLTNTETGEVKFRVVFQFDLGKQVAEMIAQFSAPSIGEAFDLLPQKHAEAHAKMKAQLRPNLLTVQGGRIKKN